ncbi:hypothetical protein ABZ806_18980 [Spirillospora sp. NPDC047418]
MTEAVTGHGAAEVSPPLHPHGPSAATITSLTRDEAGVFDQLRVAYLGRAPTSACSGPW